MSVLSRYLDVNVTLATIQGTPSTYGYHAFNTPVTYSAHVIDTSDIIRTPDGEELLSHTAVYLESSANPNLTDQLVLDDGSTPRIIDIQEVKNHRNTRHHWKVRCE